MCVGKFKFLKEWGSDYKYPVFKRARVSMPGYSRVLPLGMKVTENIKIPFKMT